MRSSDFLGLFVAGRTPTSLGGRVVAAQGALPDGGANRAETLLQIIADRC